MRYRVAYNHATDGTGEVTRRDGRALDEPSASVLAREMAEGSEYLALVVEVQERPGARWLPVVDREMYPE